MKFSGGPETEHSAKMGYVSCCIKKQVTPNYKHL